MNTQTIVEVEHAMMYHMDYTGPKPDKHPSVSFGILHRNSPYLALMDQLAIHYPANTEGERLHLLCKDYYKAVGVSNIHEALTYIRDKYETSKHT